MILLKNIIFIFLLIFLFGCGSKVDIENVIKLNLNDPDSVKFKQVLVSKDATRACTIWNAKNGLGGYGNWKITELRKTKGAWEVSDNEMDPDLCTEDFYLSLIHISEPTRPY